MREIHVEDLDVLGFDCSHAVHVETEEELLTVTDFAEQNGYDKGVVVLDDDWMYYPYLCLSLSNSHEMNAYCDPSRFLKVTPFKDWVIDRGIGVTEPSCDVTALSGLI